MFVIVGFFTLGFVLCLFLPETLERSKLPDPNTETVIYENNFPAENESISAHQKSIQRRIFQVFRSLQDALSIFKSYLLFGLSFTFLLQILHGYSLEILFQLASERFHWSLGNVSLLHDNFHLASADTCRRQAFSSLSHPSRPS
jgi:hypothetical protein